jgi:hypothetical protein
MAIYDMRYKQCHVLCAMCVVSGYKLLAVLVSVALLSGTTYQMRSCCYNMLSAVLKFNIKYNWHLAI